MLYTLDTYSLLETDYEEPRAALLVHGQLEPEGRSGGRARPDGDRAAVGLGDRAGDEEPEAGAGLAGAGRVQALELLEDHVLVLGRDAGPTVADVHHQRAVVDARGDGHGAAGRGVLDRVVDQVDEHLLQARAVAVDGRERGPQPGLDLDLVLAELGGGGRLEHELGHVDLAEAVAERPGLDPRGVHDVGDQRREAARLVGDQREERGPLLGRELAPALLEGLRG